MAYLSRLPSLLKGSGQVRVRLSPSDRADENAAGISIETMDEAKTRESQTRLKPRSQLWIAIETHRLVDRDNGVVLVKQQERKEREIY